MITTWQCNASISLKRREQFPHHIRHWEKTFRSSCVNWTGSAFVNAKKSDFHDLLQPLVMVQIGGGKASVRSVDDVADVIAGRIAAGDMLVPCRGSRRRLVANYLAGRGLVEIVGDDLMRPLGARDGELFG